MRQGCSIYNFKLKTSQRQQSKIELLFACGRTPQTILTSRHSSHLANRDLHLLHLVVDRTVVLGGCIRFEKQQRSSLEQCESIYNDGADRLHGHEQFHPLSEPASADCLLSASWEAKPLTVDFDYLHRSSRPFSRSGPELKGQDHPAS